MLSTVEPAVPSSGGREGNCLFLGRAFPGPPQPRLGLILHRIYYPEVGIQNV